MIKTGLGRRIALLFIRGMGRRSLGLGYALIATDGMLASVIPSNGARAGGILFPIADRRDLRIAARRLGAPARRLSDGAALPMRRRGLRHVPDRPGVEPADRQVRGTGDPLELTTRLAGGAIVPGLVSLLLVPLLLYRLFPPELKHTPAAAYRPPRAAATRPLAGAERIMMVVFVLVGVLWMTTACITSTTRWSR